MNQSVNYIWNEVKRLLHEHDCVIVPGFGGFVCNREPARIDQVSHIITPPARKVVFNQNLKTNDGLLAGYLARQKQITYTQALAEIEATVRETLEALQANKSLSIDLFGNFRLNADANYVFLPDKRNNYLTDSYGLSLIQGHPVASRAIRTSKARLFKTRSTPMTTKPKRNVWPSVLAGVLVLMLSINGYIFFNEHSINDLHLGNNNTMSITSWFDSLVNKPETSVAVVESPAILPQPVAADTTPVPPPPAPVEHAELTPVAPPVVDNTSSDLETYASLYAFASHYERARTEMYFPQQPQEALEVEAVAPVEVPSSNPVALPTPPSHLNTEGIQKGYYVIGGVFCKQRNAKRFLAQLTESGYNNAELLTNTTINCKRVSYQKFSSRKEAEQFCLEIKASTNPTAWVLAAE